MKYKIIWPKIALISTAGVALLSTFLPWLSLSAIITRFSTNAWNFGEYGGPIFGILIFLAMATVITLTAIGLGTKNDKLSFGGYLSGIIAGGITLLLTIVVLAIISGIGGVGLLSFGFWLEMVMAIAVITLSILGLVFKAKPTKK